MLNFRTLSRWAFATMVLCAGMAWPQQMAQHDFDFTVGTWKTQIRRLRHPLSGSKDWALTEGRIVVRSFWDGRANLEEIEADGQNGHIEGLTLRLWNPAAKQWAVYWANASDGTLGAPAYGDFRNGRGEFYDQESFKGRAILVRQIFTTKSKDAYDFEQAFSDDGGKTWEANWIAHVMRDLTSASNDHSPLTPIQHDFDFNLGHWDTHVSRLLKPLTNSSAWVEYSGASEVIPVWGGRASLFRLDVKGSAGEIRGLGLRLFNPQSHQWSLHWVNGSEGVMTNPMFGRFDHGRGDFMDQETYGDREILTRNSFSNITQNGARFEQAFSEDNGKTWETNWVMTFQR